MAAGTYRENITSSKILSFLGGYPANGGNTQDFTRNKVIIDGGYAGVAMYLKADTTIDGLTITHGTTDSRGGGIYVDGCSVTIRNSIITSNDAGGIYLGGSGNSRLVNCEVTDNKEDGIRSYSSHLCAVIGSKFIGNSGRGIEANYYPVFTITDTLFEGNLDGGLHVEHRDTTVTNCIFRGNINTYNLSGYGGGAECEGAKFIDCVFENNYNERGGGFYGYGTLENCIFIGNTAEKGGGLYIIDGGSTIKNCTISGNKASQEGGGIFDHSDELEITNCNIANNSASNGSGIYRIYYDYYNAYYVEIIKACSIHNNSADVYGGGIFVDGAAELINSTLTGNSASTGGGIYAGGKLTVKNCTLVNNGSSEFYNTYYRPVSLINTILYNSTTPYIYNENSDTEAMTLTNCAYSERSLYGSGNNDEISTVKISDWSASHPAEIVSVDNVAQTVFKLKSSDISLIHGGTNEEAPETDQLGISRDVNNPSIGAVEYFSGSSNNNNGGNNDNPGGNTNPENPDSGDNGNTTPNNPDNGGNNGTTPENPDNGNNNPDDNNTPEEPNDGGNSPDNPNEGTLSTGSGGGGGCNSFSFIYGLLVLAIILKRK